MVFLFADPLVAQSEEGDAFVDYIVPLDLESEYMNIVKNLYHTNKQFNLIKKAMTIDSLTHVIMQNPKIIHISCHGSYDQVEESKQFYLSIEADNGLEMKLT